MDKVGEKEMYNEIETRNVRIKDTFLGVEDHGIFTFSITTLGDGVGQSAGNYFLGSGSPRRWVSCEIIEKILNVVGVDSWEQLKDKYIRVKATHTKVLAIGNITEDKWLNLEEFFGGNKK